MCAASSAQPECDAEPTVAVSIESPAPFSEVLASADGAVAVALGYDGLFLENQHEYLLEFTVDNFKRFEIEAPFWSQYEIEMRVGTHVVAAVLLNATTKEAVGSPASAVLDIMPSGPILRASRSEVRKDQRAFIDEAASAECARAPGKFDRPVRILLIGSLEMGGQSVLAQEQLIRLRDVYNPAGEPAFSVEFASNSADGPLLPILEAHGATVHHYEISVPRFLLAEHPETGVQSLQPALARLRAANSFDDFGDDDDVGAIVASLVKILRGVDIVSFTNHETMVENDQFIVEAARLAGIKHILNEPGNLWWGSTPTSSHGVTGFVVPSSFAKLFWKKAGIDLPQYVINPGIDVGPSQLEVRDADGKSPTSDSAAVVAFVGRLVAQKSPGVFVRMAAQVMLRRQQQQPPSSSPSAAVKFVVLGDGSLKREMEDLSVHLGLRLGTDIEFRGFVPHAEMPLLLANEIDVVVHTNMLEETYTLTNVEAMAAGLPVVSFGVAGVSEYLTLDDDHGVVVERPDVVSLADAVVSLIDDMPAARAMGAEARTFVVEEAKLTKQRMAERYAELYMALFCGGFVAS